MMAGYYERTPEIRERLRQEWTPERRLAQSEKHTGKTLSLQTRTKISDARKGIIFSEEHKAKLKAAWTPERQRAQGERCRGKPLAEDTKRKLSESKQGFRHSEETKQRIGAASAGRARSPMTAEQNPTSATVKHLWQDPVYATEQRRKILKGLKLQPNKAEQKMLALLQPFGFKFVGDGQLVIGGKCPDYWDGNRKLVELFGDYWHAGDDPNERIAHFARCGYEAWVFWEHELKDPESILAKVTTFCLTEESEAQKSHETV